MIPSALPHLPIPARLRHLARLLAAAAGATAAAAPAVAATTEALATQPGIVRSAAIFTDAPYPQCHASTIVETTAGGLVAAWFGGTREGNPDVGIWVSRLVDRKWTPVVEVANGAETETPRVNCLNPVLFQVPGGPLLLFYKTGKWWAYVKRSTDGGLTWSAPERLYNGLFGPVKNKPVLLSDGSILSPTSTEFPGHRGRMWRVQFERSVDGGKSWQVIGPINEGFAIHAIQPSILFHPGGRLQALGRTGQGKIFEVWSEDEGRTWGPLTLTSLPNPNCGTDALTLRDGRHLLIYNHTTTRPDGKNGPRSPLNVAVSPDGRRWHAALVLENQPGEFSYPAVIQTRDGHVHVTYTWKRQTIRHVVLDPAKLVLRSEIVGGVWPQ
jgi:predicted neuraminidase